MSANQTDDGKLLQKINAAVRDNNKAEQAVTTAQAELVSKSRVVGQLLLEAKKRHPKVADFEAFLKRVDGLKLSRAYDLLRLAGGRTTDEELRQETRERVRKHRAKKIPKPEPLSVTHLDVTETPDHPTLGFGEPKQSPEIGLEERKAMTAALDLADEHRSAKALAEFLVACRTCLPKITKPADRIEAIKVFGERIRRHFAMRSRRVERFMDAAAVERFMDALEESADA
jgi:hypothetical protein